MRLIPALLLTLTVLSCQMQKANEPVIRAVDRSPLPVQASLALITDPQQVRPGENELLFRVSGYKLGVPTASPRTKELANSAKGQHIHHILDNAPYMARYHDKLTLELDTGNHVLLSFLSRSYHESVKSSEAFAIRQFGPQQHDLEKGRHLFYSRPKGNYQSEHGKPESILLDFYLLNTDLTDGFYVKAVLDGKTFLLQEWRPYYIDGLSIGEHSLSLQLMNEQDQPVSGPFNHSGIRKFTISKNK